MTAKTLAMPAVALTDHGNLYAAYKFYKACVKEGVLPILGQECYVVDNRKEKERKRKHVVLLAKNETGWKNLMKLSTLANQEGFYYRPRMDIELIASYHEGIIALTACCAGIVSTPILQDNTEEVKKTVFAWKEIFGDDFYFEVMPLDFGDQKTVNLALASIGKKHRIKLVATSDSHYLNQHDWELQGVMFKIKGVKSLEANLKDLWFRTEQEVREGFEQHHLPMGRPVFEEAIDNTMEVMAKITKFDIRPKYQMPVLETVG